MPATIAGHQPTPPPPFFSHHGFHPFQLLPTALFQPPPTRSVPKSFLAKPIPTTSQISPSCRQEDSPPFTKPITTFINPYTPQSAPTHLNSFTHYRTHNQSQIHQSIQNHFTATPKAINHGTKPMHLFYSLPHLQTTMPDQIKSPWLLPKSPSHGLTQSHQKPTREPANIPTTQFHLKTIPTKSNLQIHKIPIYKPPARLEREKTKGRNRRE